jgi:competence protein ComEC
MERFGSKKVFAFLGLLVVLNVVAWSVVSDLSKPRLLAVNFFDIGQGDAIFIETPKRQQILIDGGPGSKILEKLGKEIPFWDRDIDLVILTHPEADHLSGLIEVLKKYKVNSILWTGVVRDTPEYKEWEELIREEGAKIYFSKSGQKIKMSSGISIDILYPFENIKGKEIKDSNDTSIIGRLIFNDISFLFTGDASEKTEKELLNAKSEIASDVLKIGHHGSKTSSSADFLDKISPALAIIQVGKNNSYGHPTQEVLENLKKYGIRILRTDEMGDIKIISDGEKLKIE